MILEFFVPGLLFAFNFKWNIRKEAPRRRITLLEQDKTSYLLIGNSLCCKMCLQKTLNGS